MSTGKGKKRIKNSPVLYNELKKRRCVLITDTAWQMLTKQSQLQGVSISELIETYARKLISE
ncbi:hypothetical protein [Microseira sp. BLCC-F43]|jgi:hypothetical protein|uniref:hypothetical protein n=1 Tax=Microseira sp. BLCC-F43 TaxID=3153602 RepID=UPI0035BC556E